MKTYKYFCVTCGHPHPLTVYTPRKSDYICRDCKLLRDKANKKARSNTQSLKKRLIRKRGYICEICNNDTDDLIAHHKIPVSQGGKTSEKNVQLVCSPCHKELHRSEDVLAWKGHAILGERY